MSWSDVFIIMRGLPWTVALTLGAFSIGALLGIPIMLARQSQSFLLRTLAMTFIMIVRGVPPLVWIFTIFFGLGMGYIPMSPFTAALIGLGLIAAANMAEIYRGGMIAVHSGQWEAATALNLGRYHTFMDIIAPQTFRVALPSAASYAIGLMKDSAIASTIGVMELAYQGSQLSQMTFRGLEVFSIVAVFYILLSLPIAWLSRVADTRLRAGVAH